MNTLSAQENFMANFVSKSDFQCGEINCSVLLKPDELNIAIEGLKKRAHAYLMKQLWHNIDKVRSNYGKTFGIRFQDDGMNELKAAIATRHDLVHRNGVSTTGDQVEITDASVTALILQIEAVVRHIESEIVRVTTPVEELVNEPAIGLEF